ncbi:MULTISPECIES: serine/threonine-protein kinase [Streptomyces]|uniref:serine/threonine-protein kinase n=1 Tax=Streptomyces TaxID=1883 RepID=UPI0034232AD8
MPDDHLILRPLHRADPTALGPYQLLGRIGAGGMGRVYLANRNGTEGLYAVKTLLADGLTTDADRARFAREVKMARRAAGPRTARVFDADPHAPLPWLATEYVAAPSLGDLVARCGTAHPAAAARIVADCATALEALHSTGVIHRDLKPHNILLTSHGIRLIDFGISHATDLTRTRVTLGTVAYIAPEQARGEPATAACDIWALGATLSTLVAGRPPTPTPATRYASLHSYPARRSISATFPPRSVRSRKRAWPPTRPTGPPRQNCASWPRNAKTHTGRSEPARPNRPRAGSP